MMKWRDSYLESMRMVGDPPADEVITAVIQDHGVDRLHAMMKSLVQNDDIVPEEMPDKVYTFLTEVAILPDDIDLLKIQQGENFFSCHWPNMVTILFCASLPNAYSARKGAQVLYLTQRLTKHVHRRIFETAQFVLDVLAPGGLRENGRGLRSAQKVRLIHAATRYMILNLPEWRDQWNMDWGVPINQEDLAGTLMTFSIQILLGLKKFGISMSPEDEEAYLYIWRMIGPVLGVASELIPDNVDEAAELAEAIFKRQTAASEAGVQLTAALLDFMQNQLPGHAFDGLPATIIRHCIDEQTADFLAVPKSDWTAVLLKAEESFFQFVEKEAEEHKWISQLFDGYSQALVQTLINIERGGNRTNFTIPDSLREMI